MSRTTKGSKHRFFEIESRRLPTANCGPPNGRYVKNQTHRHERREARKIIEAQRADR